MGGISRVWPSMNSAAALGWRLGRRSSRGRGYTVRIARGIPLGAPSDTTRGVVRQPCRVRMGRFAFAAWAAAYCRGLAELVALGALAFSVFFTLRPSKGHARGGVVGVGRRCTRARIGISVELGVRAANEVQRTMNFFGFLAAKRVRFAVVRRWACRSFGFGGAATFERSYCSSSSSGRLNGSQRSESPRLALIR